MDANDFLRAGGRFDPRDSEAVTPAPSRALPRVEQLVGSAMERIMARAEGRERPVTLPWPALGAIMAGGLRPGLHLLVGGAGSGKTQLALQAALFAARAGTPVLYAGPLLGQTELVARLLGLSAGRDWHSIDLGTDPWLRSGYSDAIERCVELGSLPLHAEVAGRAPWSPADVRPAAAALRLQYPSPVGVNRTALLVVDAIAADAASLVPWAFEAARAGSEYETAVWVVVSGNVRDETRRGPAPRLWHDGSSSEAEAAAETVMVLCRAAGEADGSTRRHVVVTRARSGRPGWLELSFDGTSFSENVS